MKKAKICLINIIVFAIIISIFSSNFVYANRTNINDSQIVLVTGFEPFGIYDINPSQLIAEELNGQIIDGAEIVGIILPVDFDTAFENITRAIEDYNPTVVISLGLDAKTKTIDVEKLSINLKRYTKNESTFWFIPRFLDFGSPLFRLSTLKTKEIVEKLKTETIPAKQSFFAGTYDCNANFYKTQAYFDESVENVTRAIDDYNPLVVISLGLDAKTKTIDVEKLGINLKRYARSEIAFWFIPRFLDFGSPFLRLSALKTKEIVENLKIADISAKQSFFAGTYVCNAVFYKTLEYIDENELSTRAGFIHVPLLASQDHDGMDLEMMVEAVTIAIQTSLD